MTAEQALRRYAAERDAEAFRVLVERYQGVVYSAVSRLLRQREDVEDVTQQTFLKLAQGAGNVRENVGAWLYAAAVTGAMDRIRRDATRRRHEGRVVVERADSARAKGVEWSEASVVVDEEIARLPGPMRELIVAHFLQGEPHRGIAERLEVNSSTITRRMETAVRELRKGLAKRGYGEAGAGGVGALLAGLPRAAVPARVSGELVKVGLAGAGKAAGWAGTMVVAWCVAIAVVVGGIFAAVWGMSGGGKGPMVVASVPATAPAATKPAAPPIPAAYLLDVGEELRRVRPPFPPEREALLGSWGPYVSDTKFVKAMTFYENNGKLVVGGTEGGPTDAEGFARNTLRLYWYRYEGMKELPWISSGEDWVVRGTLREEEHLPERLAAFAKILSADIGKEVHFESRKLVRPCIIMKGKTHPQTLHEITGIPTLIVTSRTPTDADWENWKRRPPGDGTNDFQDAGWMLDAPWMPEKSRYVAPNMYVARDAHLKQSDPAYKEKLAKVLENVQAQVGAEWSIEDREIEVWRPVVK